MRRGAVAPVWRRRRRRERSDGCFLVFLLFLGGWGKLFFVGLHFVAAAQEPCRLAAVFGQEVCFKGYAEVFVWGACPDGEEGSAFRKESGCFLSGSLCR